MSTRDTMSTMDLATSYAAYFVADFARNVMAHLQGSHKLPAEILQGIIDRKIEALKAPGALSIAHTSSVGRFVYECAEFALEQYSEDLDSRATWDKVRALPSGHHRENNAIAYATADLLKVTVDQTVVGTIARDADTTAKLITQAAQARIADTDTGGTLNMFNWGILNDGLWLNSALMRAADRAHIFKADQKPALSWATQAFSLAERQAHTPVLTGDRLMEAQGEVNLLLADVPADTANSLLGSFDQSKLNDLLFTAGSMVSSIQTWDSKRNNPNQMIQAVEEMSIVARLLQNLQEAAIGQGPDTAVSDMVRSRIEKAYESVTMALVGYEVMRETRFADTLIMSVTSQGEDPKVNVFVNSDTLNSYHANRGNDEDLLLFGQHLDPRQGMPVSASGWSLEYILNSRDTVLPRVIADETERLEKMRMNDASVIRETTAKITSDVVQSYLAAQKIEELPTTMRQSIGHFSQALSHGTESLQMDEQLVTILASAHGDPFVQKATQIFMGHMSTEATARYAPAATVASLALEEAVDFFVNFDAEVE